MLQHSSILIVDDVAENISLLFEFLISHNFEVSVAENGESALEVIEEYPPNLILLDVMMPGIDGFETCRRIKANPKTQDIPIIFMTALSDTVDKVKGLELGAVDYVTKPFQQEEVLARINVHLTVYHLQTALEIRNQELEAKNAELDAFAHTVAHDLKNPLSAMINLAYLLINSKEVVNFTDKQREYLSYMLLAGRQMDGIISALLLLAKVSKQEIYLSPLDMQEIFGQAQQRIQPLIEEYQARIIFPKEWPLSYGYAPWVEEVWANYLSNALKYGGRPPILELGGIFLKKNNKVQFWVRDNGEGLPVEKLSKLFTPFTRLHRSQSQGHGLGLSIVQRIIEKLGGEVGVESQVGQGSIFYFSLPASEN